jgi:hypothetical protein
VFAHGRRLRWSGEHLGYQVRIRGLVDPDIDLGVPGGRQLLGLVDAFFNRAAATQAIARQAVLEALGPEALVDTAAVYGNFEMMNRVAEGTGIPVPIQAVEREADFMKALGLYEMLKSQHRTG